MSHSYQIQSFSSARRFPARSISVRTIAVVCVAVGLAGCRGTWNPSTQLRSEPSFERLLELESSSDSDESDSDSASRNRPNERSQVHPKVAQRRPGSRAAASRYSEMDENQDVSQEAFSDSDSRTPPSGSQPARRKISDLENDDSLEAADEHSELLQQTQSAVKNRYRTELQSTSTSQVASLPLAELKPGRTAQPKGIQSPEEYPLGDSDPESSRIVTIRMNDQPNPHAADPSINTQDPQPHVVEAAHHATGTDTASQVQPAVHNRYRNNQYAVGREESEVDSPGSRKDDLSWQQHLELAMKQLSQTSKNADSVVVNSKETIRQAMIVRLLALALGNREQMLNEVQDLQAQEQEYFNYQLTALMDAIDPEGNPVSSRRWSLVMLNQRKASEHLSSLANLEVNNLAFCTEVESFGVAEKFPQYRFTPDQEVLLYCEVDNFSSERSGDGKGYETQLQGSYEIVDANGKRVADQSLPMDTHVCRNLRRDYFIAYRVYMPQNIAPGSYSLRLTIEDLKGQKFGQSEVAFQIQ